MIDLIDELESSLNVFSFVIDGIENHLQHDEADPEQVVSALRTLMQQQYAILDRAKESAKKEN